MQQMPPLRRSVTGAAEGTVGKQHFGVVVNAVRLKEREDGEECAAADDADAAQREESEAAAGGGGGGESGSGGGGGGGADAGITPEAGEL